MKTAVKTTSPKTKTNNGASLINVLLPSQLQHHNLENIHAKKINLCSVSDTRKINNEHMIQTEKENCDK